MSSSPPALQVQDMYKHAFDSWQTAQLPQVFSNEKDHLSLIEFSSGFEKPWPYLFLCAAPQNHHGH